jgi:hypothetical protein
MPWMTAALWPQPSITYTDAPGMRSVLMSNSLPACMAAPPMSAGWLILEPCDACIELLTHRSMPDSVCCAVQQLVKL